MFDGARLGLMSDRECTAGSEISESESIAHEGICIVGGMLCMGLILADGLKWCMISLSVVARNMQSSTTDWWYCLVALFF